jgi:hypothetical protein
MDRLTVVELSPVRILDRRLRGGLQAGALGVIMARAGAGKTAFLCHLGLDALLRRRQVFHVGLGDRLEHVRAWYAALFDDLADRSALSQRQVERDAIGHDRIIKCLAERELDGPRLAAALGPFQRHMGFRPQVILVDGFDWGAHDAAAAVAGLKQVAAELGASLWMTAATHVGVGTRGGLGAPCDHAQEFVDVAIRLEPAGVEVHAELVRGAGGYVGPLGVHLETDTLRLGPDVAASRAPSARLPASAYTLLSGGAAGAEAEFGACAERHGVAEMTFTFAHRLVERHRGLVMLSDDELAQGAVSSAWMAQHLHRSFPDTPLFRKVLQSIWHQVFTAGEVFAVGTVQDGGAVTGGTGWAVQLARQWDKPVHVYDQERRRWFTWSAGEWVAVAEPRVARTRFCGTGTRLLTADGRAAIAGLFERSFGRGPGGSSAR